MEALAGAKAAIAAMMEAAIQREKVSHQWVQAKRQFSPCINGTIGPNTCRTKASRKLKGEKLEKHEKELFFRNEKGDNKFPHRRGF